MNEKCQESFSVLLTEAKRSGGGRKCWVAQSVKSSGFCLKKVMISPNKHYKESNNFFVNIKFSAAPGNIIFFFFNKAKKFVIEPFCRQNNRRSFFQF